MLPVVEVAPRNDRELTLGRLIAAAPEALYRCWTEPELIRRWFAPAPLTTEVLEMDVRPGGVQRLLMKALDGAEYPTGGVYLAVEPGRRLVFTDAFQAGWVPNPNLMMVGEISFAPQDGQTLYVARAGHWTLEAKRRHEQMGFHEGWGLCTEQLAAVAEGLS